MRHDLIFPSEAEHIWHRFIPCYVQEGKHDYMINETSAKEVEQLAQNIEQHCALFDRRMFLTKSPFNSFRMAALRSMYPRNTRFIHIVRDKCSCGDSISRNGFNYSLRGKGRLSSNEARDLFYESVVENADDRCFTITLEQLVNDKSILNKLIDWIESDATHLYQ